MTENKDGRAEIGKMLRRQDAIDVFIKATVFCAAAFAIWAVFG